MHIDKLIVRLEKAFLNACHSWDELQALEQGPRMSWQLTGWAESPADLGVVFISGPAQFEEDGTPKAIAGLAKGRAQRTVIIPPASETEEGEGKRRAVWGVAIAADGVTIIPPPEFREVHGWKPFHLGSYFVRPSAVVGVELTDVEARAGVFTKGERAGKPFIAVGEYNLATMREVILPPRHAPIPSNGGMISMAIQQARRKVAAVRAASSGV